MSLDFDVLDKILKPAGFEYEPERSDVEMVDNTRPPPDRRPGWYMKRVPGPTERSSFWIRVVPKNAKGHVLDATLDRNRNGGGQVGRIHRFESLEAYQAAGKHPPAQPRSGWTISGLWGWARLRSENFFAARPHPTFVAAGH